MKERKSSPGISPAKPFFVVVVEILQLSLRNTTRERTNIIHIYTPQDSTMTIISCTYLPEHKITLIHSLPSFPGFLVHLLYYSHRNPRPSFIYILHRLHIPCHCFWLPFSDVTVRPCYLTNLTDYYLCHPSLL